MKNITTELLLSLKLGLKDKIGIALFCPNIYEAESLEDLKENSSNTRCPWYKLIRLNSYRKNPSERYFSHKGAIINTKLIWASCSQETDYIYNLNLRQEGKSLDVSFFDWKKFYQDRTNLIKAYLLIRSGIVIIAGGEEIILMTPEMKKEAERLEEEFDKKQLNNLMPPWSNVNSDSLQQDFKTSQFVQSVTTFYSHLDHRWYLEEYDKKIINKKKEEKEVKNQELKPIYGFS